jgi:hypothetical protein
VGIDLLASGQSIVLWESRLETPPKAGKDGLQLRPRKITAIGRFYFVCLPDAGAPHVPTETVVFDEVVEAESSKTLAVVASDFSQAITLGWSFLLEARVANSVASVWTSLNKSFTGQALVGSVPPFRL